MEIRSHSQLLEAFDALERKPTSLKEATALLAEANRQKFDEDLERRKLALIYRLEIQRNMPTVDHPKKLHKKIYQLMTDWIKQYKGFNPDCFDLDPGLKIEELVNHYPLFAAFLLKSERHRKDFFKWSIRDNNAVAPFVLFPSITKELLDCFLSQRIGYARGGELKLHSQFDFDGNLVRTLTLPIEGTPVTLGDSATSVLLRDGSKRTLHEIFEVFKSKIRHPGDVEFFSRVGITAWPSYEPWKWMDLERKDFWRTAPTLRILTVKEAVKRYGKTVPGIWEYETTLPATSLILRDGRAWYENDNTLLNEVELLEKQGNHYRVKMHTRLAVDGKNFIQIFRATKENDMSFMRTHSFGELLIPMGGGRYFLFNMGKYPKNYPSNTYKLVRDFVSVVLATLQVVDDNTFYNHRNHTEEYFGMTPVEGEKMLDICRTLLILARDDKLGFEFQTEGCAKMEQVDLLKLFMRLDLEKGSIEKGILDLLYTKEIDEYDRDHNPNFFYTSLEQVNPEGSLGLVYRFIRLFPRKVQPWLLSFVFLLTGGLRGMSFQIGGRLIHLSHVHSACWNDGSEYKHSLYHPGYLHKQQEERGITLLKRKLALIHLTDDS